MKLTLFSKLSYKILSIVIAIFYTFSPYIAPSTDDIIQTSSDTGANVTIIEWADSQFSNYLIKRTPFFDAACEDISNLGNNADALLIAGDVAENGLDCEYQYISEKLAGAKVDNFLVSVGNHDVRLKPYKSTVKRFTGFVNSLNKNVGSDMRIDALNYIRVINGYAFISLGTDRTEFEESYLSEKQLEWLDENLAKYTANGMPVFVTVHQTLKNTHGLPDTWNSPFDFAGSIGDQSDELKEILNKYNNVFIISGHLHTGFGQYTYEKIGNFHSINLPSLTIDNKDGTCNDNGIGYVMEVYDSHVLFRARNFAKGKYLPENNIDIELV